SLLSSESFLGEYIDNRQDIPFLSNSVFLRHIKFSVSVLHASSSAGLRQQIANFQRLNFRKSEQRKEKAKYISFMYYTAHRAEQEESQYISSIYKIQLLNLIYILLLL